MHSVIRAPEHEEAMVPRFDLEWQKQNMQSRLLHLMSRIIMSEVKQFRTECPSFTVLKIINYNEPLLPTMQ